METDSGHNVLISAGQPLLQALIMLAQGGTPPDLTLFRQQMLQGVSRFYRICTARQLHPSLTGKSAFVWCAALDEAVLSTSWGAESVWQEHTLTGAVFQNRRGGEAFFRYLHLAVHNPVPLRDFLELQFYLLSLGFRGGVPHTAGSTCCLLYPAASYSDEQQAGNAVRTTEPLRGPESPGETDPAVTDFFRLTIAVRGMPGGGRSQLSAVITATE